MLYVLDPSLSATAQAPAREFLAAAKQVLDRKLVDDCETIDDVRAARPQGGDGVAFFNPPTQAVARELGKLVQRAGQAGAVRLPIALTPEDRAGVPGEPQLNPFDVRRRLRGRELRDDQLATVGQDFARYALSRLQPTYHKANLRIFLSYRREDAEELGDRIRRALQERHEKVFFDLLDIPPGDDFRPNIDEQLQTADVLVVLETPNAGRSDWIKHEVKTALGKRVPVVPVSLGHDRPDLGVALARSEKLTRDSLDLDDADVARLADEILDEAYGRALRHVRTSQRALTALLDWRDTHDAEVDVLDPRQLIYRVRHPVVERRYPTRPAVDVIQLFGRFATKEDGDALAQRLHELDLGPHQRDCRAFDAAFLLDPRAGHPRVEGFTVYDHPERFVSSVQASPSEDEERPDGPRLMLLGALPRTGMAGEEVFAALDAVVRTWLGLGGTLVFGGHPEFVPTVLDAIRDEFRGRGRERVTAFQSEWFPDREDREALAFEIAVHPTPRLDTLAASLTRMREEMMAFGADAVVAIGGRTSAERERPGVEEEIDLARAAGMPVYLLGAVGGETAVRASREREASWAGLGNRLSPEENERLRVDDGYEAATRLIWSHTA